jgi:hypothetical protein
VSRFYPGVRQELEHLEKELHILRVCPAGTRMKVLSLFFIDKVANYVPATGKIRSYDVASGDVIWECSGLTRNVIPCPVADASTVYCMSGFRGNALLAIRLGRTGDLTGSDAIAWTHNKNTPYVPSPLLYNGKLYFFTKGDGNGYPDTWPTIPKVNEYDSWYSGNSSIYGIVAINPSANCTFRNNILRGLKYPAIAVNGSHHLFEGNLIENCSHDAFRVFGDNHIFKGNIVQNMIHCAFVRCENNNNKPILLIARLLMTFKLKSSIV